MHKNLIILLMFSFTCVLINSTDRSSLHAQVHPSYHHNKANQISCCKRDPTAEPQ